MNSHRSFCLVSALLAVPPFVATGQDMVEYSLGVGGDASGAAGMGKSMSGIANKLKGMLEKSGTQKATPSVTTVTKAKGPAAQPAPTPDVKLSTACVDDPGKIVAGLDYQEVLRKCGVPMTEVTTEQGGRTLWYTAKNKEAVVTIADGRVKAISSGEQQRSADIVLLQ